MAFRRLGPFDAGCLRRALGLLAWAPGGRDGDLPVFAMIEQWPDGFPLEACAAEIMARHYGPAARRGATFVSRLVPGQEIPRHRDDHDDGSRVRVHVPIVTNDRACMRIGGRRHRLSAGWAYQIDPTVPHAVWNGGPIDRIHVIFNVLAA